MAPGRAFEIIAPIDLRTLFHGYGPLPAVTGTRDQTGGWDHVGASRTIDLADGSEGREEMLSHNPPHHFGYEVTFGHPFGLAVSGAAGEWRFEPAAHGGTAITWTYAFAPRAGRTHRRGAGPCALWRGSAEQVIGLAVAACR